MKQKKINHNLISDFKSEYGRLALENSILTQIIFDYLERRPIYSDLTSCKLTGLIPKNQKNILVWRYFKNNCSSCIEQEFFNIKEYSQKIGVENIVIITTTDELREVNLSLAARKMEDYRLINILGSEINFLQNASEDRPFYFVLDKEGFANMIFAPDANVPKLTEKYFDKIIKSYFSFK